MAQTRAADDFAAIRARMEDLRREARCGWSAGSTTRTPTRSSRSRTPWNTLRDVAHLRPRTNVIGAATRVRHTLAKAIHRFFDENGFFWADRKVVFRPDDLRTSIKAAGL